LCAWSDSLIEREDKTYNRDLSRMEREQARETADYRKAIDAGQTKACRS
jgi:hypothetical protein